MSVLFGAGVNHSGRLPVYKVTAGGTLRLYQTVRDVQEAAMRRPLKAVVIAGAMLTAGLGLGPLASASAATTPLAINAPGESCAGSICSLAEGNVGTAFVASLVPSVHHRYRHRQPRPGGHHQCHVPHR